MMAGMAMMTPAKPIIEPIERSNSPAIISSATAAARMPSWAETSRKLTMPLALNRPLLPATMAKKMKTSTVPAAAPNSGRLSSRAEPRDGRGPVRRLADRHSAAIGLATP